MVLIMPRFWIGLCLYCWFYLWKVSGQTEGEGEGVKCAMTLDIIIILDSSGSVGRHIWPQEVDFAKSLVKLLSVSQDDTHVGIIDFSSKSIVRVDMNKPEGYTPDSIQQTLDKLKTQFQSGVTYMDMALASAVQMYNEVPASRIAPKLLIIVTDGKATPREQQTGLELMRDEIESLKVLNVNRIAIGVGSGVKRNELDFIASYRGNVILVSTFEALVKDITRILNALCRPPGEQTTGCPQIMDLIVVLDCSGSIGVWNWRSQLNFIRDLAKSFTISQQETRIGLIVFHENVKVHIDLTKEGSSKDRILSKLSNLTDLWAPFMRTYTDLALNSAVQEAAKSRKNVPRIVLLVTDGETSFWRKPLLVQPVETLESNAVDIYSVGIGGLINHEELLYMSRVKERVFMIKNYKQLIKDINKIATKLCNSE